MITIRERAEAIGIVAYDTALPQTWFDSVTKITGRTPVGFVWSYDKHRLFGRAYPLTEDALDQLIEYTIKVAKEGAS